MRCVASLVAASVLAVLVHSPADAAARVRNAVWTIAKSEWTETDEKGFGDFVRTIGQSGCTTTAQCLKGAGNAYRERDPRTLRFIADCADFPYMLRAYYAWKHGLPFAYVSEVSGRGGDIRFEGGNRAAGRRELIDKGRGLSALAILRIASGTAYR